jgi:hypothetical protein
MTAILEARTAHDSEMPATPVFAAPIQHPSVWTVADFRSPADYSVDLNAEAACRPRPRAVAGRRPGAADAAPSAPMLGISPVLIKTIFSPL